MPSARASSSPSAPTRPRIETRHDTSKAWTHLPLYHWRSLADLRLPKGCSLVGVEILDEAHDLPSFPHPLRAAYVLGPERGALSPELAARCQHLVRIPAAFSLNLATAGAIVMYDRLALAWPLRLAPGRRACRGAGAPRRMCKERPASGAGRVDRPL